MSRPRRDAPPWDAAVVERPVEALGVGACVEGEHPRIDAAVAECRQQREQMLLGAADALHLDQMENPHRSRILL